MALEAWNLLGGFDLGPALDRVADLLGVTDMDMLIAQLCVIRDFKRNSP